MDEKLKSLLERVVKLSTQNKEFGEALRRELGVSAIVVPDKIENDDISNIEKYLGLDFYIDSKNSTVDYSFIDEEDVRDQLVSDNREMMRYRYGTRSHKIDFPEFCRYAHMQAEMLINYFYDVDDGHDFNAIVEHIREYNSRFDSRFISSAKKVEEIPFRAKWFAFSYEFKMLVCYPIISTETNPKMSVYDIIDNTREVRNEINHRGLNGKNYTSPFLKLEPFYGVIESLKIVAKTINDTWYEEQ